MKIKLKYLLCFCFTVLSVSTAFAAAGQKYILQVYPSKYVFQGASTIITAKIPKSVTAELGKKRLRLRVLGKWHSLYYIRPGVYRLPLGVSMKQQPGKYRVSLYYRGKKRAAFYLYVKKKKFKGSIIKVPAAKKENLKEEYLKPEARLLGRFLRNTRTNYFRGVGIFKDPVPGRVTSYYGNYRKYKDQRGRIIETWRHKGIDFAGRMNTPIRAANNGKVILVRALKANGNTILLDHGQGVITIYTHMNKMLVKEGDVVKRGQIIGRVGNSGVSTGPHLHFGVSVSNVRVDPRQWLLMKMVR